MSRNIAPWIVDRKDNRPIPEIVINKLGGQMAYIDTPEGKRLYSVRDWVYFISGSKNKNLSAPWSDLKKSFRSKGLLSLIDRVQPHNLETAGGNQISDFADVDTLLEIKKHIESIGHKEFNREVINIHPHIIEWLKQSGWAVEHHVILPSGKVVDILAHGHAGSVVVECKPSLGGQRLFLAIGQVLCYASEYGNVHPAIATLDSQVTEYGRKMCSLQGITLITLPVGNETRINFMA